MSFPDFFALNDRLVKVVKYPEGGYDAMALDMNNGDWVLAVLVEEFGRFIDDHLRDGVGDAKKDEGAKFGYSLLNLEWRGKTSSPIGNYVPESGGRKTITVDWSEGFQLYPSHTQLAKDHDDHPLHDVAAQMAISFLCHPATARKLASQLVGEPRVDEFFNLVKKVLSDGPK